MPDSPLATNPAPRVALETTLLLHGVPRDSALPLARELDKIARENGAEPALTGVYEGRAVCGLGMDQLAAMLKAGDVPKINAANLGLALHRGGHGATTVSATMEIAAGAGVRVFATGGLGGVHRGEALDVSSDLTALTRFAVAVVCSGVKSILDAAATREILETLGIPVVGFAADLFPAFYRRSHAETVRVDARFDDVGDLAAFVRAELGRAGRAVVVCNPIPADQEIAAPLWDDWLGTAEERAKAAGVTGRAITPFLLDALHDVSGGRTLEANLALVKSNTALAAQLAVAMG